MSAAPRVELYGTGTCPYTAELREHLQWNGIAFAEYDVDRDQDARGRLAGLTGRRAMVPVLVEDGLVTEIGWRGRGCPINADA